MAISRSNYEEYLADYLDGNLDPVLSAELLFFLSENPDLEKQYRELESDPHSMPAGALRCPHKESLKKDFADIETVDEFNFDEFCIAETEGLLTDEDKQRLLHYIDLHPQRAEDHKRYSQTILRPGLHLIFPGREMLKKAVSVRSPYPVFRYALRIAAAIAAIVMVIAVNPGERTGKVDFAVIFSAPDQKPEKEVADNPMSPVENRAMQHPAPAAAEKIPLPVPGEPERDFSLALIHSIPSAYLHNPYIELPPMEKSLHVQTVIPDNTVFIASLPAGKKAKNEVPDLLGLVQKVDVWKTAGRIVDGVNYLTETRIQLYSALDDQGKLTDFVIRSEAFSIVSHRND